MAMTPAMESIFANAQQNAASLIETATLAINAKVNTIEEAEAMIQELSSEAVKFNELLTCIMNAMRQVESGDMQKEEAAGIIAPAVKELKDKCTALKIANVEAPGDDITEDEIATLRELIIGAKAAAEDRLVAIRLCDDCKVDPEVENELNPPEENGEAFEFDPATEGISSFIQKMHAKKVNKAKVTVLMDSLKDKKTEAIVKKVVDAMKPALVAGADGLSAIKRDVDEMQKADGGDPSKYEGKLSSFDYVVKTISGVGVGYIPENPSEGTGLAQIMVPTKDHKGNVVGTVITIRTACEYILNPIKESEVTEAMEAYEEIAEEATILAAQYVNTTECKTAKALYQNAKKLYSLGSKEKALEYMKKAKSLYEGCLKKLMNESGKFEKAERTDTIKKNSGTSAIRHNVTRTDSLTFAIARSKLENKIDRCTAHILQWTTKAGKETYQQTLDQLKADREQAKAAKKATKAATENYEMEVSTMNDFDIIAEGYVEEAMEDYMEFLATEGANSDARKIRKNYAKEVRTLAKEAKQNYKAGNYSVSKAKYTRAADLCKEMAKEVEGIDQTIGQVWIGNILHQLKVMATCLIPVYGLVAGIKEIINSVTNNISALNKVGKGELSAADFNNYTRSIINNANKLAAKYTELANKAGKGEATSTAPASESFDYDEFMFAAESYMDELQMELDTDSAMEAEGVEDGSEAPSTIGNKLRSALAKFKGAFKRGDKDAAEEAKKEVEAAADELAAADAGADEKKKGGLSKAAKIGLTAAGTVAAVAGLTAAGIAISQKAKGEKVDVKAGASAIKKTVGAVMHNFSENQKNAAASRAVGREERKAAKKDEQAQRAQQYFADQSAKHREAQINKDNKAAAKYNAQKAKDAKKAAKIAAKAAKEAFGVSEFDAYEAIFEAMMAAEDEPSFNDEDLAASIEAML